MDGRILTLAQAPEHHPPILQPARPATLPKFFPLQDDKRGMGATGSLAPFPNFGSQCRFLAGSDQAQREKLVPTNFTAFRPGAPSSAFSMMLDLLEILRNLVLSGHEPASFLIALETDGRPVLVSDAEPAAQLPRLRSEYGSIPLAFLVSARRIAAGILLQVAEPTGHTGYCLDQLCREYGAGTCQVMPHCWRPESFSSASSAYHSTSGLIPYWGLRNSSLLNHRIS